MWTDTPPFSLTIDEARALYLFYLRHPHVGERDRQTIDLSRKSGQDRIGVHVLHCAHAKSTRSKPGASTKWKSSVRVDAELPGRVCAWRCALPHGRASTPRRAIFEFWIDAHPDGAWTLARTQSTARRGQSLRIGESGAVRTNSIFLLVYSSFHLLPGRALDGRPRFDEDSKPKCLSAPCLSTTIKILRDS